MIILIVDQYPIRYKICHAGCDQSTTTAMGRGPCAINPIGISRMLLLAAGNGSGGNKIDYLTVEQAV